MTQLSGAVVFAVVLTTAVPVCAQQTTTQDLNRQELNLLTAKTVAPVALRPAIGYSIVPPASIVPPVAPVAPAAPPQVLAPQPPQPDFTAYTDRMPLPWLYRYYGYQTPTTYQYINLGSSGYYAPVPTSTVPYWD